MSKTIIINIAVDNLFTKKIEIDLYGMTTERLTKRLSGEMRVFIQSIHKELELP